MNEADIALQEAYEATDVVAPTHPEANHNLFRARITTTDSDVVRQIKEQLATIKIEIKTMVGAAT